MFWLQVSIHIATVMLLNECGIERLMYPDVEEGTDQWDCKWEAQHVEQPGPNLEDLFIGELSLSGTDG